jgi:hypothetical protein
VRPVGPALGALARGEARALVIGEAVGAARVGGYYGISHSRSAVATHPTTNARDVGSFQRRGSAAVGAAVGTPAASVYYGGTSDYPNDGALTRIDAYVIRWARRKFKRMRHQTRGARDWFERLRRARPTLFAHWTLCHGNGRTSGAV